MDNRAVTVGDWRGSFFGIRFVTETGVGFCGGDHCGAWFGRVGFEFEFVKGYHEKNTERIFGKERWFHVSADEGCTCGKCCQSETLF